MMITLKSAQLGLNNIRAQILKLEDEVARINNNNYWIVFDHLVSITTGWFFKRPKFTQEEIECALCHLKKHHWYDPWNYRFDNLKLVCTSRLIKDIEILNDILAKSKRDVEITLNDREFIVLDEIKFWR